MKACMSLNRRDLGNGNDRTWLKYLNTLSLLLHLHRYLTPLQVLLHILHINSDTIQNLHLPLDSHKVCQGYVPSHENHLQKVYVRVTDAISIKT